MDAAGWGAGAIGQWHWQGGTMSWDARTIKGRCSDAENERARLTGYIDAAYEYAIPWRKKPGSSLMPKVFDSSGPAAVANFAGRLSMALVPPEERFFALRPGPLVEHLASLEEREADDRDLELTTDVVNTALRAAGFDIVTGEAFCDLALSTGAVLMQAGDARTPLTCVSVPAYELALEDGPSSMTEVWHWRRERQWRDLARLFPSADWSRQQRDRLSSQDNHKVEVIQTTYWDNAAGMFKTGVVVDGAVVQETQHRASPWITPRYWRVPGMAWGVGPLLLALADIRTLNKNLELVMQAAELALAPPIMVADDGVINPDAIELSAYSMIRVGRLGGNMGAPVQPLQLGGRLDVGQLVGDDARARVRRTMMDNPLPPDSGAVRSPTEILERARAHQMDTGGAFGRLAREYVSPAVLRTIDILDRWGVPGCEWDKVKPDGFVRKVQVTSPLARGVQLDDANNYVRFLSILTELGGPELMGLVTKIEDQMGWLADMMGVPNRVLRPKQERDAMLDAQAQAAQAQAMQQQQLAMAQAGVQPAPAQDAAPVDLLSAVL
jgi:hypothetical protein